MTAGHGLYITADDPESGLTAVFDDDGKVAYAYLLQDGRIVADVWLYNRAPTPDEPDWRDRSRAPFLNPKDFVVAVDMEPPTAPDEVAFGWKGHTHERTVVVYVHGRVLGQLAAGQRPGYAALAKRDGPLARVLRSP